MHVSENSNQAKQLTTTSAYAVIDCPLQIKSSQLSLLLHCAIFLPFLIKDGLQWTDPPSL